MTKKQIKEGCQKAIEKGEDLQIMQSVEWLMDYNLIDWKTRCAIYDELTKARKLEEAV